MANLPNEQQMLEDRARRSVFPFAQPMEGGGTFNYMGLQKRELFAAMAMQGMCANPNAVDRTPAVVAGAALEAADALLTALDGASK